MDIGLSKNEIWYKIDKPLSYLIDRITQKDVAFLVHDRVHMPVYEKISLGVRGRVWDQSQEEIRTST